MKLSLGAEIMANEQKQKALQSAQDFTKYLVVLAVGAIGFALTRLDPNPRDTATSITVVVLSCLLLAVSIFLGILAYGTLISQLDSDRIDLERNPLAWQAQGQWICFFVGVVFLGVGVFIRDVLPP